MPSFKAALCFLPEPNIHGIITLWVLPTPCLCADSESFIRGVNLFSWIQIPLKRAGLMMAQTLNDGLVALWFTRGSRPCIVKEPYNFVIPRIGAGSDPLSRPFGSHMTLHNVIMLRPLDKLEKDPSETACRTIEDIECSYLILPGHYLYF